MPLAVNETKEGTGYHAKSIWFTGAKFADLFDEIHPIEDLLKTKRPPGTMLVAGSGLPLEKSFHFNAKPCAVLDKFLDEHMRCIVDETYHFRVSERSDGTYLVTVNYGTILGSRWLTITTWEDIEATLKELKQ